MNAKRIQSMPPNLRTADDWQTVVEHISGTFVVLVMDSNNRYVRRCYMTIASAQRAARRASERGHSSTVILSELRPLKRVPAEVMDGA